MICSHSQFFWLVHFLIVYGGNSKSQALSYKLSIEDFIRPSISYFLLKYEYFAKIRFVIHSAAKDARAQFIPSHITDFLERVGCWLSEYDDTFKGSSVLKNSSESQTLTL